MDSSHSPSQKMANETSHNAEVVSLPTDDSRASKRVRRILFAPLPIAGGGSQENEPRKKGVIRKETEEDATFSEDDETWIRNYSLMVARLQRDRIFGRFQEQKKELTAHRRQITELNDKMKEIIEELEIERINRMCFCDEFDDLEGEMEALKAEMEKWVGRTLKFEFLFKQIKRVGLESSEDIFDTFQDIEVPEVSIKIKKKYVPTVETDAIDYTDYEQDREFYGDAIGPEIGADDYNYASEDEEEEQAAVTIQRAYRKFTFIRRLATGIGVALRQAANIQGQFRAAPSIQIDNAHAFVQAQRWRAKMVLRIQRAYRRRLVARDGVERWSSRVAADYCTKVLLGEAL